VSSIVPTGSLLSRVWIPRIGAGHERLLLGYAVEVEPNHGGAGRGRRTVVG
jgi:hypothetical protein